MPKHGIRILTALVLIGLTSGCGAKKRPSVSPQGQAHWSPSSTPFRIENVTVVGNVFWACGADETIGSSVDGGNTWKVAHQNHEGGVLLNIAFINDKVGHAAGKGGRLLSTADGGKTWDVHNAGATIWTFSFADARNGIAVIGGRRSLPSGIWGEPTLMTGPVRLTHDGGDHWEDIAALTHDELRAFNLVLAVAALDSSHYLMIREHPEAEDAYVITNDGGKSWKLVHQRDDATNRELASWVFVHGGEYWAFGMELVHRDKGGGYGVPLTLHCKDGETWTHGINGGLHEYGGCNPQGCFMWDGTIETLYGEREQYWALPQDGSLSFSKWAIAGSHACNVSTHFECGPAVITEAPQPRPETTAPSTFVLEPKWEE
jgi:hypothetical protein